MLAGLSKKDRTKAGNGITAAALPYDAAAEDADIVIRWGGEPAVQDSAAIRICPAEDGGNLLVRISPAGRAAVTAA